MEPRGRFPPERNLRRESLATVGGGGQAEQVWSGVNGSGDVKLHWRAKRRFAPTAQVTATSTWQLGSGGEREIKRRGRIMDWLSTSEKHVICVGIFVNFLESYLFI